MSDASITFSGWASSSSMSRLDATPKSRKSLVNITNGKQKKRYDPDNYNGWRHEILNKVNMVEDTPVLKFIDKYVPGGKPYRARKTAIDDPFAPLWTEHLLRNEFHMYPHLVTGLNQLCKGMPRGSHLLFVEAHSVMFGSPFPDWTPSHGKISPDIAALKPGVKNANAFNNDNNKWKHVSLIVEVKSCMHVDPVMSESEEAQKTLMQMSKVACRLMLEQASLCCFVLGIYGKKAHIYRYDHASAIASEAFDYREYPDYIRRFLWNFANPKSGLETLGQDDLSSKPTERDMLWARDVSGDDCTPADIDHNRWVTVPSSTRNGRDEDYLLLRVLSMNYRMFSRATIVREALKRGDISGKRYIIKESWRQVVRSDETVFYKRIKEYCDRTKTPLFGIGDLVCGVDLGAREVGAATDSSEYFHRTVSSEHRESAHPKLGERSHMRLVLGTVGRQLKNFLRTWQLTYAIHDAILGHQLAYKAGVLHRDVSPGNVMISEETKAFKGFILDFDYSSLIDSFADGGTPLTSDELAVLSSRDAELRERTGTFAFLAFELLNLAPGETVVHTVHHDLQSFYWLLIWIVLRHTAHTHFKGNDACHEVFPSGDEASAASSKISFMMSKKPIEVKGNRPLSHLLSRLSRLVAGSVESVHIPQPTHLTHMEMLRAFKEALDMDGWPEDDAAIPFKPSNTNVPKQSRRNTTTKRGRATVSGTHQLLKSGTLYKGAKYLIITRSKCCANENWVPRQFATHIRDQFHDNMMTARKRTELGPDAALVLAVRRNATDRQPLRDERVEVDRRIACEQNDEQLAAEASLQSVRLVDFGAVNVHLGDELLRELLLRGQRREGDEAVAHGIGKLDA
ncbi:predicted protein [Postia placenta Mad-698-R]|nr:predicted protein [Postia placenta Mad-698-R]